MPIIKAGSLRVNLDHVRCINTNLPGYATIIWAGDESERLVVSEDEYLEMVHRIDEIEMEGRENLRLREKILHLEHRADNYSRSLASAEESLKRERKVGHDLDEDLKNMMLTLKDRNDEKEILEQRIHMALLELGVPADDCPEPIVNAVNILHGRP